MRYPVVIHKDKSSDYGVTVPDLPGCFSAGTTMDEAMTMAKEAIELHLEAMIDAGLAVPDAGTVERHQRRAEYKGGTWAVVTVEEHRLPLNAKRINVTMPQRVLDAVDRYADENGMTRSGLLTQAASRYIGRVGKVPAPRRGRPRKRRTGGKRG